MSDTPTTADRRLPPDPTPGRSAGTASVPEGIARLLSLLHWLIGYGQQLACNLQQRVATDLPRLARRYNTSDLAVILARVRRGLMLAAGLEGKLVKRAATGRDVVPVPARRWKPPTGRSKDPPKRRAPRCSNVIDLPLDRLPSAEEIAAELRRRPIGAVLADICRDLGIVPNDLPSALRLQLRDCVTEYGGSLVALLFGEDNFYLKRLGAAARRPPAAARIPAPPVREPAYATGPP